MVYTSMYRYELSSYNCSRFQMKRSSTRRYDTIFEYKWVRTGLYRVRTTVHDSRCWYILFDPFIYYCTGFQMSYTAVRDSRCSSWTGGSPRQRQRTRTHFKLAQSRGQSRADPGPAWHTVRRRRHSDRATVTGAGLMCDSAWHILAG
jgi:hypothetical protein